VSLLAAMLKLTICSRTAKLLLMVIYWSSFHPLCCFILSHQSLSKPQISVLYSIRKDCKPNSVNDNKDEKESKNLSGYQFFRGDGPYVPSGMSREDYARIRNNEIEKERRMNYGAWGPRFKRTSVPEGDWMIMPNLWTAGQVNRPSSRSGYSFNDKTVETSNGLVAAFFRVLRVFQKHSAALVVVYFLLGCLQIGFSMWKCKEEHMNPVKALLFVLNTKLLQKQVLGLPVMKMEIIKLAFSISVIPFVNIAMERLNRRYLWSKQRMYLTTLAFGVGVVGMWGLLLKFITFS
jgi:hypothetical protein